MSEAQKEHWVHLYTGISTPGKIFLEMASVFPKYIQYTVHPECTRGLDQISLTQQNIKDAISSDKVGISSLLSDYLKGVLNELCPEHKNIIFLRLYTVWI